MKKILFLFLSAILCMNVNAQTLQQTFKQRKPLTLGMGGCHNEIWLYSTRCSNIIFKRKKKL